jgi:hypothetical protein
MSIIEDYRQDRVRQYLVHAARFIGILVLLSLAAALGWELIMALDDTSVVFPGGGNGSIAFIIDTILLAGFAASVAWLPAAALTAAWARSDGGED